MTNVELHPFLPGEFKDLIPWIRDPDDLFLWSATTFHFPLDESQLERHYQGAHELNNHLMYTAVDSQTREKIGHIELARIDLENKKASIAYVLVNPAKRGRGYGKGMMASVLNECFIRMKLSKVDLFVFESNITAINLYQSLGFETVELIKDRIQRNGKYAPLYLMELDYEKWIHENRS